MISVCKCPSCNKKINYGSNYCQHCGAELEWEDDESDQEEISTLNEEELVIAYGRNGFVSSSNSSRIAMKAAGGIAGLILGDLFITAHNALYSDYSEIKLCHSKTRLYGIAPNRKHEVIDVRLSDISVDYTLPTSDNFGDFIIKNPNKAKTYTYQNVYMPNRFYKSIMSALSGKFDKSIYQSGLKDLPQRSRPNENEDESDESDEFDEFDAL